MASGCIRTPWGLRRRTCPTEPLQSGGLRAHVAESLTGQDKLPPRSRGGSLTAQGDLQAGALGRGEAHREPVEGTLLHTDTHP